MSVAKTRVGCPEEPHLRGVLEVRFRRSSNTHRIAGLSQCVGCGVIQEEECKHPWERKVYPSDLGVGWSVKARRTLTMGTFTVSHVG